LSSCKEINRDLQGMGGGGRITDNTRGKDQRLTETGRNPQKGLRRSKKPTREPQKRACNSKRGNKKDSEQMGKD